MLQLVLLATEFMNLQTVTCGSMVVVAGNYSLGIGQLLTQTARSILGEVGKQRAGLGPPSCSGWCCQDGGPEPNT